MLRSHEAAHLSTVEIQDLRTGHLRFHPYAQCEAAIAGCWTGLFKPGEVRAPAAGRLCDAGD